MKSCLQGGITPGTTTRLRQMSAKQHCKNSPGSPGGQKADNEPAPGPCSEGGQQPPRLHRAALPAAQGNPPLCSAPVTHQGQECCVQCWAPQYKRDRHFGEQDQQKATKMMKGLELLSYKERPRAVPVQLW